MTKPKTLKLITGNYAGWDMFTNTTFSFAHARREKNKIIQLTEFDTCRESFANRIYDDLALPECKLSVRKLQCLVRITIPVYACDAKVRKFGNQTKAGIKVLNILEDHYDWPLTKMFDVEPTTHSVLGYGKQRSFSKLLVGSSKWRKSSHMLSLFLLLFRLPTRSAKFYKVENYEQLMELCRQYAGLPEPGSKGVAKAVSGDKHYIARTMKFWDPLMTNLDKMFKGMIAKRIFDKDGYHQRYRNEGISKLCGFQCSNTEINKRFAILAKNAGIKLPTRIINKFGL